MKKQNTIYIVIGIIVIALVVWGIYSLSTNEKQANQDKPVKIGIVGPLTGTASEYGQNVKKAINLAVEEINNANGVNGRNLKTIYEDSACKPSKGVTAIKKLINMDKTSVIIDEACSSVGLAEAPIAENNKALLMLPTASNYKIKEAGDYIFRVYPNDAFQGKKLAETVKSHGHKKVGVIYINNDYGQGLKKVFKEEFEKLGGEVAKIETHEMGETDFRSIITKIETTNPSAILLAEHPEEGALLLKQLKELDTDIPVYASDAMKDKSVIENAGEASEDLVTVFPVHPENEGYEQFKTSYENKYGETPERYAAYGYDALNLLTKVIKKVGTNATKIKNELYKINDYKGVTGVINFDKFGERTSVNYKVYTVKNGEFVPYEE